MSPHSGHPEFWGDISNPKMGTAAFAMQMGLPYHQKMMEK